MMAGYSSITTTDSRNGLLEPPPGDAKSYLLASHAFTKLGSKAWEFATPLLLLQFSPNSLFAPVAFGLVTQAAQPLFGPMIGGWADRAESRLTIVFAGCAIPAVTSAVAIFLLASLLKVGGGDSGVLEGRALVLFVLLCLCGVFEKLANGAASVAVAKDWVPTVFDYPGADSGGSGGAESSGSNSEVLTSMNALMSRIDLTAEFLGPFLAGLVLSAVGQERPLLGFAVIGLGNAASFVPQYFLLRHLYFQCARLRLPRGLNVTTTTAQQGEGGKGGTKAQGEGTTLLVSPSPGGGDDEVPAPTPTPERLAPSGCGCLGEAVRAWPTWLHHPGGVWAVSVSYALLYFTALSPHGIPLTAFLASGHGGVGPLELSLFRGAGALAGIVGLSTFEWVKSSHGLRRASWGHVVFETFCVLGAAASFSAGRMGLFMALVVGSRVGLYGFDVGFMELQQRQVEEQERNAVGAVDSALTSVATFAVYAVTLHVASPESFARVTWASALSVCGSALLFGLYLLLWHEHPHEHDWHEEVKPGKFLHPHTTQQIRALELARANGDAGGGGDDNGESESGKGGKRAHVHVHYAGPPQLFSRLFGGGGEETVGTMIGGGSGHGHDHSHGHSHDHAEL